MRPALALEEMTEACRSLSRMSSLRFSIVATLVTLALLTAAYASLGGPVGSGLGRPASSGTLTSSRVPWRTIGRSVEGRPIEAATFGSGRCRVLYLGGVHGHEYGADVAEQLAHYLADHPGKVPRGLELHVIRCLNPGGRARLSTTAARGPPRSRSGCRLWACSFPNAMASRS